MQQFAAEAEGLTPQSVPVADRLTQQRQALADCEAALSEIRRVPGFAGFLTVPSAEQIIEAAAGAPLVYITAADDGGLALIVSGPPPVIRPVWLPLLGRDELVERIIRYLEMLGRGSLGTDLVVLDNLGEWLWEAVAGPILAELASPPGRALPPKIVLVPTGLLAMIPLHAAWRADDRAPSGRTYLIDECAVTYAANARAMASRHQQRRTARIQIHACPAGQRP